MIDFSQYISLPITSVFICAMFAGCLSSNIENESSTSSTNSINSTTFESTFFNTTFEEIQTLTSESSSTDSSTTIVDYGTSSTTIYETESSSSEIEEFCGDGIVNGNEECELNGEYGISCLNCKKPRSVFVTDRNYFGNIPGPPEQPNLTPIEKADWICQSVAIEAKLEGVFLAWLTDSNELNAPYYRFKSRLFNGWYKVANQNILMWQGWDDLIVNYALNINYRATGEIVPEDYLVWTNTFHNGKIASKDVNCNNWTSNDSKFYGVVGSTVNDNWSNYAVISCNTNVSLYCFQVDDNWAEN